MFLGIDTSCYTTSIALLSKEGALLQEQRQLLEVKPDGCGLRQSEMVFQHMRNLPVLFEKVFATCSGKVNAVAVSERPRPLAASYMPAFVCGTSFARAIASVNSVPLYLTSHQQNHIEAGLWSAEGPKAGCFIALHASGGTTDVLLVQREGVNLSVEQLSSGLDLHAGQFVDRVGVELGLSFPCGKQLELLAQKANTPAQIPVAVKGLAMSFSGPLTATKKLLAQGLAKEDIAMGVQIALAKSFAKLLANVCAKTGVNEVLFVGGVASNIFIRDFLVQKLGQESIMLHFPQPVFCSDNAVGCAVVALRNWRESFG